MVAYTKTCFPSAACHGLLKNKKQAEIKYYKTMFWFSEKNLLATCKTEPPAGCVLASVSEPLLSVCLAVSLNLASCEAGSGTLTLG